MAYGLPILHYLLRHRTNRKRGRRPVRALILTPTRELALQVADHLRIASGDSSVSGKGKQKSDENETKKAPAVSVAAVVGGMSVQKQRRLLARGVDVIVATPGRLWDILEEVRRCLHPRLIDSEPLHRTIAWRNKSRT